MIRKLINVSSFQYLSDFYTLKDFDIGESINAKFVLIRNFKINNRVISDTDIFIMSKDAWFKMCTQIEANKDKYTDGFDINTYVVFPIKQSNVTGYSACYSDFNDNFTRSSLYKFDKNGNMIYGDEVYPILDENGDEKTIKCNKIKFYHPIVKTNLNAVIAIENYMNNIHWYYLCDLTINMKSYSYEEIRYNWNTYSEYIEIIFPSIDELFKLNEIRDGKEIYNAYFNERLNTIVSTKNESYISRLVPDNVERYYNLKFSIDTSGTIDDDGTSYYFYVGNENPITETSYSYEFKDIVDIYSPNYTREYDTLSNILTYIKDKNISVNDREKVYILFPKAIEKNLTVSNLLDFHENQSLPVFEILCDTIYNSVIIDGKEYKMLRSRPRSRSIRINNKSYYKTKLKYFYFGNENPLNDLSIVTNNNKKYYCEQFHDIQDIFDKYIEISQYRYSYNQYYIKPEDVGKEVYILFPLRYENEIIITNMININYNEPIFEINYSEVSRDIVIDDINYILYKTVPNSERIRIYIISNTNSIIHDESYQGNDTLGKYFSLQNQLVPLSLLLQPFRIVEDYDPQTNDTHNVKLYIKQNISIENNYITNPFSIIVYPFKKLDAKTNHYEFNDYLAMGTNVYFTNAKFSLKTKLGFDINNHRISLLSEFDYPKKEEYLLKHNGKTDKALQDAYQELNNINIDDYEYYWVNRFLKLFPEKEYYFLSKFDEMFDDQEYIDKLKKIMIDENGNECDYYEELEDVSDQEKLKRMIRINYDDIFKDLRDWEVEEEFETSMDFIGFRIQLATDDKFRNLIYNKTFSTDINKLDNFALNINNIFESWFQVPEFIIGRTIFIDHILNRVIYGNPLTISKEYIKYIMNDTGTFFFKKMNEFNDMIKEINLDNISYNRNDINDILDNYVNNIKEILDSDDLDDSQKQYELDVVHKTYKDKYFSNYSPFNFINNINCIVNKSDPSYTINNSENFNSTKIIYQPIFYRTNDLQNLRIKSGVSQNIGINLVQYMTKVETFKLLIDGAEYVEYGRNDIYVIFKINATLLNSTSGTYNIVNQDDEYISSGSWVQY